MQVSMEFQQKQFDQQAGKLAADRLRAIGRRDAGRTVAAPVLRV
jgi:hypothetical protein